jgi:cation diffusion facilitator CzcD-associated flavoprotein CzcO
MHTQLPHIPIIVIGAGFSGVAMGAQLKRKLGLHDYVIYERSPDFGGTWWANVCELYISYTYHAVQANLDLDPGCAVDIPSIFYSLSFAPNPDFTQFFSNQSEILQYIKDVAKKFDVDTHIRVNMSWEDATWEEATKTWSVRLRDTQTGEIYLQECNILISGVGGLVNPNPCTIPGADTFEGVIAHTARWRKDIILENKNVVVIGNGCSGSQVVPAIADKVRNIYQFCRSPQFYFPQNNVTIHPLVKWAFRYVPFLMVFLRYAMFNFMEYWFIQFYTDDRGNRHRLMRKKLSDNYVEKTAPKEYWDLLKPTYKVGCKRRVFDSGYLRSLHRDNVHLTNDAIVKIQPTEVITESGKRYPADVIVSCFLIPCI